MTTSDENQELPNNYFLGDFSYDDTEKNATYSKFFFFLNLFRIHMQIKTLYTFTDRECDDLAISLLIENTLNIIYAWKSILIAVTPRS